VQGCAPARGSRALPTRDSGFLPFRARFAPPPTRSLRARRSTSSRNGNQERIERIAIRRRRTKGVEQTWRRTRVSSDDVPTVRTGKQRPRTRRRVLVLVRVRGHYNQTREQEGGRTRKVQYSTYVRERVSARADESSNVSVRDVTPSENRLCPTVSEYGRICFL